MYLYSWQVSINGHYATRESMPKVNPDIMRWARRSAGLTPEQAVQKLGINAARGVAALDRLAALEAGESEPSRPMLARMAKYYRRPLIIFYLPGIPRRGDRGGDFRKMAVLAGEAEAGLVDAMQRDLSARQSLVKASMETVGEAEPLPFIGSMQERQGVDAIAVSIAQTLGFSPADFRGKAHPKEAFAYTRKLAEDCGVFVLLVDNLGSWHTSIGIEAFRGFALADSIAPFVAVNANDSPSAWSFTLVHELAHLWIGATGISGGLAESATERFCNDVASEFLLPSAEIAALPITPRISLEKTMGMIDEFAHPRNVSSTMVAYKLHRAGIFGFERYRKLAAAYRKAFLAHKAIVKNANAGSAGGPSYYVMRRHRVGATLMRFVDRMMHEGHLSVTKAARVLGIKARNVYTFLDQERLAGRLL